MADYRPRRGVVRAVPVVPVAPLAAGDTPYMGEYPVFAVWGTKKGGMTAEWAIDKSALDKIIEMYMPWVYDGIFDRQRGITVVHEPIVDVPRRDLTNYQKRNGARNLPMTTTVVDYRELKRRYSTYKTQCKILNIPAVPWPGHVIEDLRVAAFAPARSDYHSWLWITGPYGLGLVYRGYITTCGISNGARIAKQYRAGPLLVEQTTANYNYDGDIMQAGAYGNYAIDAWIIMQRARQENEAHERRMYPQVRVIRAANFRFVAEYEDEEEPDEEEPAVAEPAEDEPDEEEPAVAEPAEDEPVEEEPDEEEPDEEEPAVAEPAEDEPDEEEPDEEEPAEDEPDEEEPAEEEPDEDV